MAGDVARKLTTVFCADVEGYGRLMQADEAGTLARLRVARESMSRLIERHRGRVINTWGDAVIAEFASPVEAVQAAVEVQRELATHGKDDAAGQPLRFRIGVNLGDVMIDGDDIYGEGVNAAARLQALAEPGGVMIAGTVYDLVHRKLSIGFEFAGRQSVKQMEEPLPAYRLLLDGTAPPRDAPPADTSAAAPAAPPPPSDRTLPVWQRRAVRLPVAMIGLFFLINLFAGMHSVWFQWPSLPFLLMLIWNLTGGDWQPFRRRLRRR